MRLVYDEKCLLRGTDWAFKQSGLRFVFKGLISPDGYSSLLIVWVVWYLYVPNGVCAPNGMYVYMRLMIYVCA
jgi:hypothetical protein